jgi:hypothetical protein
MVQKPKSRLTTTKLKVQSVRLFSNPAPLDSSRLDNRRDILFANAGRPTRGWQAIPCEGRRPDHVTPQLPGSRDHETTGKRDPPGPARRWRSSSFFRCFPPPTHKTCGDVGAARSPVHVRAPLSAFRRNYLGAKAKKSTHGHQTQGPICTTFFSARASAHSQGGGRAARAARQVCRVG